MHPVIAAILAAGTGGGVPVQYETGDIYNLTGDATLTLETDGSVSITVLSGSPDAADWYKSNPVTDVGDNWECYLQVNSGTIETGTTDTWLPLTSAVTWTNSTAGATAECQLLFRPAGGSTAVYTSAEFVIEVGTI